MFTEQVTQPKKYLKCTNSHKAVTYHFREGGCLIVVWLYYDQILQVVIWIHEIFVALSNLTLLLNINRCMLLFHSLFSDIC